MSDTSQGPGWWQASDGKWYPPDQGGAAGPPGAPPKPVVPAPNWVRPVYLYFLSFIGVLIAAFGLLGFLLGLVHLAAPDLHQGDPIFRISSAIIEVAEATIAASEASQSEGDFAGGDVPPEVNDALDSAKDEIRSQAREAALNELVRGVFMVGIGAAIYVFHVRKADVTAV